LFDEALPGWEQWRELLDVLRGSTPCSSWIASLKMQKYVCFLACASRMGQNARRKANTGVLRYAQNDKQKKGDDTGNGMRRSMSAPDVSARCECRTPGNQGQL
jgi:hypothetical protein